MAVHFGQRRKNQRRKAKRSARWIRWWRVELAQNAVVIRTANHWKLHFVRLRVSTMRVYVLDAVNACNARMVLREHAVSDVNVFGRDGYFHCKVLRMNVLQRKLMLIVMCVRDWVILMDAMHVSALRKMFARMMFAR